MAADPIANSFKKTRKSFSNSISSFDVIFERSRNESNQAIAWISLHAIKVIVQVSLVVFIFSSIMRRLCLNLSSLAISNLIAHWKLVKIWWGIQKRHRKKSHSSCINRGSNSERSLSSLHSLIKSNWLLRDW